MFGQQPGLPSRSKLIIPYPFQNIATVTFMQFSKKGLKVLTV